MRELKVILILLAICFVGCRKERIDCGEFCATPERHQLFVNFEIEKQFEYFRTCPCWGDSISEKYIFAKEIAGNEQIVDFLLNKLRNERDEKVLADSMDLLKYVSNSKKSAVKKEIADSIHKIANELPEKDEPTFLEKISGEQPISRKEKIKAFAREIEETIK